MNNTAAFFSLFLLTAMASAAAAPPKELSDLPLFEIPAQKPGDTLAVFITGDGGWAQLDRSVSGLLAQKGVAVVGLSSLKYFWHARTPEKTAADVARILRHYLAAWKKDRAILVGYSFGADVLPPVANRLPPDLLERVHLIALIAASPTATFEIHLGGWLGLDDENGLSVVAETRKLHGKHLLCLYGQGEKDESSCPQLAGLPNVRVVALPGAHKFRRRYDLLVEEILR